MNPLQVVPLWLRVVVTFSALHLGAAYCLAKLSEFGPANLLGRTLLYSFVLLVVDLCLLFTLILVLGGAHGTF
jgi:hypothetical protein